MVEKICIRKGAFLALLLEYWWLTYCPVRFLYERCRIAADCLELLNPATVTGLVMLHSERYESWYSAA